MNSKLFFTAAWLIFLFSNSFAQTPVDVTERTFKLSGMGGEETFYFGFAEGDQLIFNFEEANGKEIKEVEITEYPSASRFMDYKTNKIINKKINVTKTAVYQFRFLNTAIAGRVCKFKLQRIPGNDKYLDFNTDVYWKTLYDTIYTNITEDYLVSRDTVYHNVTDQVAKVHSQTNLNGNKTTFNFVLPENTVAWSYYIGVDQEGQDAYARAVRSFASSASPLVSRLPGYGPLIALALNGVSFFTQLQKGEDIDYYICTGNNASLFLNGDPFYSIKKGKVLNDFSQMTTPLSGMYHFCFYNDNAVTGVTVTVKILAVSVTETWGKRPVRKYNITSQKVPCIQNQR